MTAQPTTELHLHMRPSYQSPQCLAQAQIKRGLEARQWQRKSAVLGFHEAKQSPKLPGTEEALETSETLGRKGPQSVSSLPKQQGETKPQEDS